MQRLTEKRQKGSIKHYTKNWVTRTPTKIFQSLWFLLWFTW